MLPVFSNKKYTILIQTRTTQIENNMNLFVKPGFNRILKDFIPNLDLYLKTGFKCYLKISYTIL